MKTASQWFIRLFIDPLVYESSGLTPYNYQEFAPGGRLDPRPFDQRFIGKPFPRHTIATPLYMDWGSYDSIPKPEAFRTFFVMRDPRDVLVSLYFSMRESHVLQGRVAQIREQLQGLSLEDGLAHEMGRMRKEKFFHQMRSWYERRGDENIRVVRFEDVVGPEQFQHMRSLFDHIGIAISDAELERLLDKYSFGKLKKESGDGGKPSHYRKGSAGDWQNYLGPEQLRAFTEASDDLCSFLGYE